MNGLFLFVLGVTVASTRVHSQTAYTCDLSCPEWEICKMTQAHCITDPCPFIPTCVRKQCPVLPAIPLMCRLVRRCSSDSQCPTGQLCCLTFCEERCVTPR